MKDEHFVVGWHFKGVPVEETVLQRQTPQVGHISYSPTTVTSSKGPIKVDVAGRTKDAIDGKGPIDN